MHRLAPAVAILLLAACAGEPEPEPEAEVAMPPAEATLADFAGHWTVTNQIEGSADPVMAEMMGTAAGTDWVLIVSPDQDPVPMQVSMAGDSMIAVTQSYASVLRPGSTVVVRVASVLQDGRMVGNSELTYETGGQRELVTGTFTAERAAGGAAPME